MPTPIIKTFAKETGKSLAEVEKLWDESKELAKQKGLDDNYAYIVGILKNKLGIGESMSRARQIIDKISVREAKASDAIKDLIDTDFSASDDEKGKAAQLLRGLFFSKEPEAVEFIKKLDSMLSKMEKPE